MPRPLRLAALLPALLLAGCYMSEKPLWPLAKGSTPIADGDYGAGPDAKEWASVEREDGRYRIRFREQVADFVLIPLPGARGTYIAQLSPVGFPSISNAAYAIVRPVSGGGWEYLVPDCKYPAFAARAQNLAKVPAGNGECHFDDRASVITALARIAGEAPADQWQRVAFLP